MVQRGQGVFQASRPLVLASASPRRRELLEETGLEFIIRIVEGAEPKPYVDDEPSAYVMRAAQAKAEAVARMLYQEGKDAVVLGADTVVVLMQGNSPIILGKPETEDEALAMLESLVGQEHAVCTGCCLCWPDTESPHGFYSDLFCDTARVTFGKWNQAALQAYVATGECMDKAGAYAIQGKGAFLVESIRGLWSTIVGLPVSPVLEHLLKGGAIRSGGELEFEKRHYYL